MSEAVDVFISYSRADRDITEKIARQIEIRGMQVWWDLVSIRAGQDFEALVRRALNRVKCVVVLWTASSIDPDRSWVRAEAKIGYSRNILVPAIFVHPDKVPLPFILLDSVDLRGWDGSPDAVEIKRLIDQIESRVRAAIDTPDDLDPSPDYLAKSVGASLQANEEIGAIVADIRRAVPRLRDAGAKALAQLDIVLDEVHATVRAVNEAVVIFLKPALSSDPIDKNPDPYLELASRDLSAVIEEGRGHCGDITTIYFGSKEALWQQTAPNEAQALRYWVHKNLDTASAKRLDDIFRKLSESDWDLFTRMGQVGHVLSSTATDVVRLLAHARPQDARTLVVSSIDTLQPLQNELANCLQDIRRLQNEIRQF